MDKSNSNDDDDDSSNEGPLDEEEDLKLGSFLNNGSAKQMESFEQHCNTSELDCIVPCSTFETHELKVLQQSISIAASPTDVELELRNDGSNIDEASSHQEECRDADIAGVEPVDRNSGEWTTICIQRNLRGCFTSHKWIIENQKGIEKFVLIASC